MSFVRSEGGALDRNGREERCIHGFGGETQGEKITLEDLIVDGREALKWVFKKSERGLAQDRDRWRALVSTVMNVLVP